tara:strand:+ start:51 stop:317 length:267 start_codon:yes stop_codon:yes gene_type:complete
MTFQQRITHYLGHSIGSLLRVFRSLHRRPKLSPTSSVESSKTLPKTPSQDSPYDDCEDALRAYREAAKADAFLFGDYDGYKAYNIEKG